MVHGTVKKKGNNGASWKMHTMASRMRGVYSSVRDNRMHHPFFGAKGKDVICGYCYIQYMNICIEEKVAK